MMRASMDYLHTAGVTGSIPVPPTKFPKTNINLHALSRDVEITGDKLGIKEVCPLYPHIKMSDARCCGCKDDEPYKYGECFCLCHTRSHQPSCTYPICDCKGKPDCRRPPHNGWPQRQAVRFEEVRT